MPFLVMRPTADFPRSDRQLAAIAQRLLSSAALLLVGAAELSAQQAHLAVTPTRPAPGALVRLTLTAGALKSDSIVAVTGTMAGEPLHLVRAHGAWRAIGAVPIDSGGEVVARVIASVNRSSALANTSARVIFGPLSIVISHMPSPSRRMA